jgi:IS30 family transposase
MGRKPKLTPHQQAEAIKRRDAGEPMRDIAKSFNVSHSTISRLRKCEKPRHPPGHYKHERPESANLHPNKT